MGTVVGSNISNIALIFGVSCIGISYRPTSTPILQFIPFFLAACFLGYALYDLRIDIFESLILILILLVFLFVTYKTNGTGLGLSLCKTLSEKCLIEISHHQIQFDGTDFRILIPAFEQVNVTESFYFNTNSVGNDTPVGIPAK